MDEIKSFALAEIFRYFYLRSAPPELRISTKSCSQATRLCLKVWRRRNFWGYRVSNVLAFADKSWFLIPGEGNNQ